MGVPAERGRVPAGGAGMRVRAAVGNVWRVADAHVEQALPGRPAPLGATPRDG